MSDVQKDKAQKREKRTGKAPSEGSHGVRGKETTGKTKEWVHYANNNGGWLFEGFLSALYERFWLIRRSVRPSVCTYHGPFPVTLFNPTVSFQLCKYRVLRRWAGTPRRQCSDGHNHGEHLPDGWDNIHLSGKRAAPQQNHQPQTYCNSLTQQWFDFESFYQIFR